MGLGRWAESLTRDELEALLAVVRTIPPRGLIAASGR